MNLEAGLIQDISIMHVGLRIVVAFILSFIIATVYRTTHKGFTYSQGFIQTLIILAMVISIVMMVIGNNVARAFSLVGALSIIRFRTVVKDTRDTAFVFFALAIGMAAGSGAYAIAFVTTALISLLIMILHWANYGTAKKHDFVLKIVFPYSENEDLSVFQETFQKYLSSYKLVGISTLKMGSKTELTYHIKMKEHDQKQQLVRTLSETGGVEKILLFDTDGSAEK